MKEIEICGRKIGPAYTPLVIAEIGINHEGNFNKAIQMIDDAARVGCECVKFQCHVIEDEMIPNEVIPGNAKESIYRIMSRCAFTFEEEMKLKEYTESRGIIFLSTPFSRAAAIRLQEMGVAAFKIGSGECNNFPLIEHIAHYGKPIILSTGMNNIEAIKQAVGIIEKYKVPYAIMHCTSIYPTPYSKVRLGCLEELQQVFPDAILGLSDHSLTIYPCLGAVPFGASILERHFTSNKKWPGPDIQISMGPEELHELIEGSRIIHQALGGTKDILNEEMPTINFAYACVVAIRDIKEGEIFNYDNIWVKRPGTGEILAKSFEKVIGKKACVDIPKNKQLKWEWID